MLVVRKNHFRPVLADRVHYFTKKHPVSFKLPTRVIQHCDVTNANNIGSSALFSRSDPHNPIRCHLHVVADAATCGALNISYLAPLSGPESCRGACTNLGIIKVSEYHHCAFRNFVNNIVFRHLIGCRKRVGHEYSRPKPMPIIVLPSSAYMRTQMAHVRT